MKLAGLALAVLLSLTACGGSSDNTPTPKTSKSGGAPKVSLATACQLIREGEVPNSHPYDKLIAFAAADSNTEQEQVSDAHGWVDQLRDIAKRSPDDLAVQLQAMTAATNELFDALKTGGSWSTTDFKAAGIDVTSQCEAYFQ